jgi:cytochrome P450
MTAVTLSKDGLPNGPRAPRLVQTARLVLSPYDFLDACARRYGKAFTLRLVVGGVPIVMFWDPAAIKEIYAADPADLPTGEAIFEVMAPLVGQESVLVLDGPSHLRERRMMLPPLHGERMHLYARTIRDIAAENLTRWERDKPFSLQDEMQAITLEVILRTVFGFTEGQKLERLRACLLGSLEILSGPWAPALAVPALRAEFGGLSPWGRFVRNKRELRTILFEEVETRRAEGTAGRKDILSLLLDARDDQKRPMTDGQLYDEMFTLLMAGHETTATSLAWVFFRLLRSPDVLARVREEIATVTGGDPAEPAHLSRLVYLEAVIHETMRLHPVSPFGTRRLMKPVRIGGFDLPSGVNVAPCIYLAHRNPDVWPEPLVFKPDRFLGKRPSPYQFFPFGGGTRRCVGAAFAMYEMKIVLAHLLPRVELRIADGYRMRPLVRTVTVGPSGGVRVVRAD